MELALAVLVLEHSKPDSARGQLELAVLDGELKLARAQLDFAHMSARLLQRQRGEGGLVPLLLLSLADLLDLELHARCALLRLRELKAKPESGQLPIRCRRAARRRRR